jgi:hypothetical protein
MRLYELEALSAILYILFILSFFSILAHPLFIEIKVMVAGDEEFEFCVDGLNVLHSLLVSGETAYLSEIATVDWNIAWRCGAAWGVGPCGVSVGDEGLTQEDAGGSR